MSKNNVKIGGGALIEGMIGMPLSNGKQVSDDEIKRIYARRAAMAQQQGQSSNTSTSYSVNDGVEDLSSGGKRRRRRRKSGKKSRKSRRKARKSRRKGRKSRRRTRKRRRR